MGTRPFFFTLSVAEPRVARALFELAKLAYLDNPLPADFKERLFTYLSRFCPARLVDGSVADELRKTLDRIPVRIVAGRLAHHARCPGSVIRAGVAAAHPV